MNEESKRIDKKAVLRVTRHISDRSISQGRMLEVRIKFVSPDDGFNAIGLTDFAPIGWNILANCSWCTPPAMESRVNAFAIDYIWAGPYNKGTELTAIYKVEVPFGANESNLTHLRGTLKYFIENSGPTTEIIGGDEYKILDVIQESSKREIQKPKALIAHGGESPSLDKLKKFLEAMGVHPLVVEEQASEDRSVGENVDWYSLQSCCAIILATKGDIDGKTGGFIPRGNVLMEIGKLQQLFKGRIIYLLQSNTKFPSNISEKVWGHFSPQSMDKAFTKVARELTAFGILKAVKPE